MRKPFLPLILIAASLAPTSFAATLHVSKTGDGADGLTWQTAYPTISEALLHSASGDHIWVAAGVYNESIQMVTAVHLYGGFSGTETLEEFDLRDPALNVTVIDPNAAYHAPLSSYPPSMQMYDRRPVVEAMTDFVIDGFTLTRGQSALGAGMYIANSHGLIRNCRLKGNVAFSSESRILGGALYAQNSDLKVIDSVFTENLVVWPMHRDQNLEEIAGGAIYSTSGNLCLENCVVSDNRVIIKRYSKCPLRGGGIYSSGTTLISSSYIEGNSIEHWMGVPKVYLEGAGVYITGKWEVIGTIFSRNLTYLEMVYAQGSLRGGALLGLGEGRLRNNIFIDSPFWVIDYGAGGGGVRFEGLLVWVDGNTEMDSVVLMKNPPIPGVYPPPRNRELFLRGSHLIRNSILLDPDLDEESIASMQVSHSIVHPGAEHFPGRGNIDADPMLDEDFRPLPNSPAIDAGTITHLTTDLAEDPRPVDIPGVGIEGPGAFDIGAYEFQLEDWPSPTPTEEPTATPTPGPMLSDIDGDELVNWVDLFLLQQDWLKEASAEQVYKTDLNEDEWVDAFDLLILLNAWRGSR